MVSCGVGLTPQESRLPCLGAIGPVIVTARPNGNPAALPNAAAEQGQGSAGSDPAVGRSTKPGQALVPLKPGCQCGANMYMPGDPHSGVVWT
jgi:hypothetical protein